MWDEGLCIYNISRVHNNFPYIGKSLSPLCVFVSKKKKLKKKKNLWSGVKEEGFLIMVVAYLFPLSSQLGLG